MPFHLENRPTDPKKLASYALAAVFVAVVFVLFVAPMIVRQQYGAMSPGDRVSTRFHGFGVIDHIDDDGTVWISPKAGEKPVAVPRAEVTEL